MKLYRIKPRFKSSRIYIPIVALITLATIQLAVPGDRVLPRTMLGTTNIGWKTQDQVKEILRNQNQQISLTFADKSIKVDPKDAGITTNIGKSVSQLPLITNTDRLIPFKPIYRILKTTNLSPAIDRDVAKIKAFSINLSKSKRTEPTNASTEIKDGELLIKKDIPGVQYDAEQISRSLMSQDPYSQSNIVLKPKVIPAEIKEQDILPLKTEFTEMTNDSLTVKYGQTTKVIESTELKKWLSVELNPETKKYSIVFKPDAIEAQLQTWAKEYNVSPGITQISYRDDVETSRNTGESGRALLVDEIKSQIKTWFEAPSAEPIVLASTGLAPSVVETRTFSRSSAQLQAQVDAWVASHRGKYQIAIRELNGKGREASFNVSQQTVMASTYKPFLAFVAYKQAESGAIDLNAPYYAGGPTVERCIEIMIINSENDCTVKLGRFIGWAKVDKVIAASGFEGIVLNNYDSNGNLKGDKLVNAREQAKFLAQLSGGSLMSSANSEKLINYMKRQAYSRAGIPAGSRGAPVANKIGELDNYVHDVAIVYGRSSTYALVIMSEGSSYTNIKDLAQAVYDFMNE